MSSIEIRGTEHHDPDAIKACLATHARERFGFILGGEQEPQCGVPPFDASRVPINLWAWPWTEWPLFDRTTFERDLDRVERWYMARGYYDARVTSSSVRTDPGSDKAEIEITVKEGDPSLIVRIGVAGLEGLDAPLKRSVYQAIELHVGEPFDEALYERSKHAMQEALADGSYAKAEVGGAVEIDPDQHLARVAFTVKPGPACRFGNLSLEGQKNLPSRPILAAAGIKSGQAFSLSALRDARYAILALGPFSAVDIEQKARPDKAVVDLQIKVVPARMWRFGVGAGIDSGLFFTQEVEQVAGESVAQWDVHLLGRFEHRNFLGGMRRLRIEDRPRLVFSDAFPKTGTISPGNLLTSELRQPGFAEARTTLIARARWDRGPDPYGGNFQRHLVVAGVGPERPFFQGKLVLSSSINTDLYLPDNQEPYPNNKVFYMFHVARVDLRDDARNTRRGSFFVLGVQHGGYFLPSDWNYVRLTGDARGYLPLPGGLVLAGRARLGFMAVTSSDIRMPTGPTTDPNTLLYLNDLREFGPLSHRLRGGGPNSVRGYAPNTLGDAEFIGNRLLSGGLRQWEASLEVRVPVSESFGTVWFVDAGDVSRTTRYRFDYPQTSFGLGLRYRTIVGPLRLDGALAPKGLQVIGADQRVRTGLTQSHLFGFADGALSFTIGEAF